jgi:hypothetical protein
MALNDAHHIAGEEAESTNACVKIGPKGTKIRHIDDTKCARPAWKRPARLNPQALLTPR